MCKDPLSITGKTISEGPITNKQKNSQKQKTWKKMLTIPKSLDSNQ